MFDPETLIIIFVTFLLAGLVKGVIGLGLPTVSLGILAAIIGLAQAMPLLLVPSFVTNVTQGLAGPHTKEVFKRIWPFLITAALTILLGAQALVRVDFAYLSGLLGLTLVVYALLGLTGFRLTIRPSQEKWWGPVLGFFNGVLGGMTGSFAVPGVMYLQALGLSRDQLVQAMGMLFATSTLTLAFALQGHGMISQDLGLVSMMALVPAFIGLMIGQKLRKRLSEAQFKKIFFFGLIGLGLYIIVKALG